MTDCPNGEIRDVLPDLVNGILVGDAAAGVEAHVRGCPDCTRERDLIVALRDVIAAAPPVIDAARLAGSVPSYSAPIWWGHTHARMAAGIALFIIGMGIFGARAGGVLPRFAGGDSRASMQAGAGGGGPEGRSSDGRPMVDVAALSRIEVPVEIPIQASEVELAEWSDDAFAALIAEIESMDAILLAEPQRRQTPVGSAVFLDLPDSLIFVPEPGDPS